jgi:catechol 2,3-dioxygenase-like lactoylglutathione lyase family enzyme
MHVARLGWCGTRTPHAEALAGFYGQVLGLPCVLDQQGQWVFRLPDGGAVEVFTEAYPGKEHFVTGPVPGFVVDNLVSAVAELRAAGIELAGDPGPAWQQFRGPDGNIYELTAG